MNPYKHARSVYKDIMYLHSAKNVENCDKKLRPGFFSLLANFDFY